ncbi:hypothetical protein [Nocardioides taihuensis]|uniref:Uncharacterized protein n=1 Tax=Nocardioides taihuensis TaxID=1835606 RepID=A0ABW0BIA2_9ACTN
MRRSFAVGLFVALAILCATAAVWLALDNPEIHGADNALYTCAAPWDTAVNDADNVSGGEPVPGGADLAVRCVVVGEQRFDLAVVAGTCAVLLGLVALALAFGTRSRPVAAHARHTSRWDDRDRDGWDDEDDEKPELLRL